MKKKKRSKLLAVLLVMATGTSLLQAAAEKLQKKKMQKPSQCIYGAPACMINMHHTSRDSFRISMLNL